jgi:hypothetical protein
VNNKHKKLLVVLTMHRSGSSAITNSLPVLGVHLGDSLLPGIEGNNPKGFFEDQDLNALNIEMLKAVGNDWHHLAPLDGTDFDLLQRRGFILRATEMLRAKTKDIDTFGFKDPRVSKLLPIWQKVFAYCRFEVGYLLILRNPISVARSLHQRNAFVSGKSYLLWLQHVLAGVTQTEAAKRVIVDYDEFLLSPDSYLETCAERFGLKVDLQRLHTYKSEFLDPALRHTHFAHEDFALEFTCPHLVHDVYSELRECTRGARDQDETQIQERAIAWTHELERLKPVLLLTDTLSSQVDDYYHLAMQRGMEIANQRKVLSLQDTQFRENEQARRVELAALQTKVGELTQSIAQFEEGQRKTALAQATHDRDATKEQMLREQELNDRLLTTSNKLLMLEEEYRQTLFDNEKAGAYERNNLIASLAEAQHSLARLTDIQDYLAELTAARELQQQEAHVARENALSAEKLALQADLDRLNAEWTASEQTLNARLHALQAEFDRDRQTLEQRSTDHQREMNDLQKLRLASDDQTHALEQDIQSSRQTAETLQNELAQLRSTLSWRWTAPIRTLRRWLAVTYVRSGA